MESTKGFKENNYVFSCIFLRSALLTFPCVKLHIVFEIEHAGLFTWLVSVFGLLGKAIQCKFLLNRHLIDNNGAISDIILQVFSNSPIVPYCCPVIIPLAKPVGCTSIFIPEYIWTMPDRISFEFPQAFSLLFIGFFGAFELHLLNWRWRLRFLFHHWCWRSFPWCFCRCGSFISSSSFASYVSNRSRRRFYLLLKFEIISGINIGMLI